MTPMPILFAAFAGLLVGSFLNVVALRMPRGVSFVSGSSHCMSCENPVKPWDNIPLFSWLLLRGRCRSCGTGIAARYPLVEAGTAALAAVTVAVHHDDTAQMVLGLVLIAFLVPMALIDLEHRIIPNKLTGPAAIAAIVIGLALDPGGEPERLIAGAAGGGFFLLAALAAPGGMGMGDVKLAGVLGPVPRRRGRSRAAHRAADRRARERGRHRPQGRRRRPQDSDPVRPVPGLRRHRRDARRHGPHGLVPEHLLAREIPA